MSVILKYFTTVNLNSMNFCNAKKAKNKQKEIEKFQLVHFFTLLVSCFFSNEKFLQLKKYEGELENKFPWQLWTEVCIKTKKVMKH